MTKLKDIPPKDIYKVPEGYYEELFEQVTHRIGQEPQKGLLYQPRFKLILASIVIILLALWYFLDNTTNNYSIQDELSTIDRSELLQFAYDNDFSITDITSELDIADSTYTKIMDENLDFNDQNLEEEILMELEKNSYQLL